MPTARRTRRTVLREPSGMVTFTDPGAFSWKVPAGVTELTVQVASGPGGDGGDRWRPENTVPGGSGVKLTAAVTVSPLEVLHGFVGVRGDHGNTFGTTSPEGVGELGGGEAGWGADASPASDATGGQGGGSSDLRRGPSLADRIVVAGGGGGAGGPADTAGIGGAGGDATGGDGEPGEGGLAGEAGGGGTGTGPGDGGSNSHANTSGTDGDGHSGGDGGDRDGSSSASASGGGGGGGWYGGGGGAGRNRGQFGSMASGGGAGASVARDGATLVDSEPYTEADGFVTISWGES